MIWQLIANLDIIINHFHESPIPCNLEQGTIEYKPTSGQNACVQIT